MSKASQNIKIVVVGSCIVEYSIRIPRFPRVGETVLGSGFAVHLGGKGANQATALSRLGAEVAFFSRTGDDAPGEDFANFFSKEGMNIRNITKSEDTYTGICMPIIFPDGANIIVVDPGASMTLASEHITEIASELENSAALQIHLEIPIETVRTSLGIAHEKGIPTFLNPAPIIDFDVVLLKKVDVLVPNETEAAHLANCAIDTTEDAFDAARKLKDFGPGVVVITLGSRGALLLTSGEEEIIDGFEVDVVDTTGAGDAFCAGLLFARTRGKAWRESVIFANACGALATTRQGGIPSMPSYQDVKTLLNSHNLVSCLFAEQDNSVEL